MKIIHKLLAAGALAIAGIVALTLVTLSALGNISHDVHTLTENDLPASNLLLNIDRDAYQAQLALERFATEDSAEHAASALEDFTSNAAQTEERFVQYEEVAVGEDGEAAAAELYWESRAEWLAATQTLIDLRTAGVTIADEQLQIAVDETGAAFEVMREHVSFLQESIYEVRAASFGPKVVEEAEGTKGLLIVMALGALLAAAGGVTFIARQLSGPMRTVTDAALALSVGDTSQEITHTAKDETGELAEAFRNLSTYLKDASSTAKHVADGDLTITVIPQSEADQLGTALRDMIEGLRDVVGSASEVTRRVGDGSEILAASSEESSQAATEVATSINSVADGTTDQAVIAEGLASAVAKIVTEIEATTEVFGAVASASADAEAKAGDGGDKIDEAIAAMGRITDVFSEASNTVTELGEHSERVEEIVDLIRSIAEQTNLLALNAAIEAARAGEMGRGFAVVASEVKSLAEESSQSTEQIAEIVGQMRESVAGAITAMTTGRTEVDTGSDVVNTAGHSFAAINDAVKVISVKVDEASRSTSRIQDATDVIGTSSGQLTEITEAASAASAEVAASSEQAAATSEEIGATAQELSASAKQLRDTMERFTI